MAADAGKVLVDGGPPIRMSQGSGSGAGTGTTGESAVKLLCLRLKSGPSSAVCDASFIPGAAEGCGSASSGASVSRKTSTWAPSPKALACLRKAASSSLVSGAFVAAEKYEQPGCGVARVAEQCIAELSIALYGM